MHGGVLTDEPAVGVEQDALFLPVLGDAREIDREDLGYFRAGVGVLAAAGKLAVVVDGDDVGAQVLEGIGGGLGTAALVSQRHASRRAELDGSAKTGDPDVGTVDQPIVVADAGEAVRAPAVGPRILNPETFVIVGDDGEGVAAEHGVLERDVAGRGDMVPAAVDARGGVEHADLGNGAMHGDEVFVVDAEVGAEGPGDGVGDAIGGEVARISFGRVGPDLLGADAVFVPTLHGAASARAGIVFAGPLVVAARHLVEHARADGSLDGAFASRAQQEVGDGGEAEAGAGALGPLVEDRGVGLPVHAEGQGGLHLGEGRNEHPVPEIEGVGAGVEDAICGFGESLGHGTGSIKRLGGAEIKNISQNPRGGCLVGVASLRGGWRLQWLGYGRTSGAMRQAPQGTPRARGDAL